MNGKPRKKVTVRRGVENVGPTKERAVDFAARKNPSLQKNRALLVSKGGDATPEGERRFRRFNENMARKGKKGYSTFRDYWVGEHLNKATRTTEKRGQ